MVEQGGDLPDEDPDLGPGRGQGLGMLVARLAELLPGGLGQPVTVGGPDGAQDCQTGTGGAGQRTQTGLEQGDVEAGLEGVAGHARRTEGTGRGVGTAGGVEDLDGRGDLPARDLQSHGHLFGARGAGPARHRAPPWRGAAAGASDVQG